MTRLHQTSGSRKPTGGRPGPGVLPSQQIERLIADGRIRAADPVQGRQVQPASIDLRLGRVAHRLQASFLPGANRTVAEGLGPLSMTTLRLDEPTVLETGCVYLVELAERLALPAGVCGRANPKSTTGRLDVFTRLIADRSGSFEHVPAGYEGPLYAEIMPRTFPVIVRAGLCLSQMRFIEDEAGAAIGDAELAAIDQRTPLAYVDGEPWAAAIDRGIRLSVSLRPGATGGPQAYRGRPNAPIVDMLGRHDPQGYWEATGACPDGRLILNPGDFYVLASRERVRVPADYAAEMVPFDPSVGELRVHYAGFFDPGFGDGPAARGACAVLEVRAHEIPFVIEHGQVVARLEYSRMAERPDRQYGAGIGSSYQHQGLALGKQFHA